MPTDNKERVYGLMLAWADGVSTIPLKELTQQEAEKLQRECQADFDKQNKGTKLYVIKA